MVSLLILKYVRNLSDENLVEQWLENCYYQYFSGEQIFQPKIPCVPTELVAFRKRIGESGVELILKESIRINKSDNNSRVIKRLSYAQRFKKKKNGAKEARKANKKIQIIAGRLLRDIARKLPLECLGRYLPDLKLYQTVLSQKRGDSNKIYSLHEPNVKCYSKGKDHKKFEFGSKASIIIDQSTGVILGALNFTETLYDSKTIPEALEQYERLNGTLPKEVFVDRGYRGKAAYKTAKICIPKLDKHITKAQRKKHCKRAAIEPVIRHLKQNYRLCKKYLKGILGDNMNLILAAAAMNFKRRMNLWRTEAIFRWLLLYKYFIGGCKNFYAPNLKTTF